MSYDQFIKVIDKTVDCGGLRLISKMIRLDAYMYTLSCANDQTLVSFGTRAPYHHKSLIEKSIYYIEKSIFREKGNIGHI